MHDPNKDSSKLPNNSSLLNNSREGSKNRHNGFCKKRGKFASTVEIQYLNTVARQPGIENTLMMHC